MSERLHRSVWEKRIGETESPIEGLFLDAFCKLAVEHGYNVANKSHEPAWTIIIEPQRWFERYRVDFFISYPFFGERLEIVVECDGHDFHERTKAQAKRDRQRDRALQRLGAEVFRFTGSEIVAAQLLCADEVLDTIETFQTRCCVAAMSKAQRDAA